jgi:trimeric autotransporter adhesin
LSQAVANPFYGNGGVGYRRDQKSKSSPVAPALPAVHFGVCVEFAPSAVSQGISVLASYTWSRSKDNVAGLNTAGSSNIAAVTGPQNVYNLNGEWSLSTQDVPNRFTMAATYELPFGKGKKFLNGGRVLDHVVGGWSLNTFGIIQSGFPLSITQSNANRVIGASHQRPNATGADRERAARFNAMAQRSAAIRSRRLLRRRTLSLQAGSSLSSLGIPA